MGNTKLLALAGKWWFNRADLLLVRCPGRVTHMSYYIYEWVMTHVRMRHVPFMNTPCLAHDASCRIYQWVMWHIRHTTYMNESWHTYECVMCHLWIHHVSHMTHHVAYINESCDIYVILHIGMSHDTRAKCMVVRQLRENRGRRSS